MSIETTDSDDVENEENETEVFHEAKKERSKKHIEILENEIGNLFSVRKFGTFDELEYEVKIDPDHVEPMGYIIDTVLEEIRDAGFKISNIHFDDEHILVKPENVIEQTLTEDDIRRIFDSPMKIIEMDYIDGAYDLQLDGRYHIDSETTDRLREYDYQIADVSSTFKCRTDPFKYVAIKPIE